MKRKMFGALLTGLLTVGVAVTGAQTKGATKATATLGTVKIARNVLADGKPLAAGSYTLRVSDEMPAPVVGQAADEARWVEFLQGTTVKGREMATVLSKDELKQMAKKDSSPVPSDVRVEMLKGEDQIMRVWFNHAGVQYLIHLTVAK